MSALALPLWPPLGNPFFAHAATFYNEWRALKVSNPFALAMVTMAEFESAFRLDVVGDNGHAFNAYQWWWHPRGEAILAATGIDVRTETSIHRVVAAAWLELNGPLHKAREAIEACDNAKDAAIAACIHFEGAGAPNAAERRGLGAERWATFFTKHPEILAGNPAQAE